MGLFNNFFKNKKEEQIRVIRGYLVTNIEILFKKKLTVKELEDELSIASRAIMPFIEIIKPEITDFVNTIEEVSPEHVEEFLGLAVPLCWIRYVSLSADVKSGRISEEDAKKYHNLNNLFNVIHSDVKRLLKYKTSSDL